MKDDQLYLDHILERIALIEVFTQEGKAAFDQSVRTQEAVLRCLEIIGEAANKLSTALREREGEVPWGEMIALRNILIHNYDSISLAIVWKIVEHDVPALKAQVTGILARLDDPQDEG